MFTRIHRALRRRNEPPPHGQPLSAAATVPTELLLAILEHLRDPFPPDTRTLHAAALVCKHWHTHGANALLYERVLLASHDACILLDRTVSKKRRLAALIVSLNLLPCPIYPLSDTGSLIVDRDDLPMYLYRHWPDDGRSSRAILRVLGCTYNLEVLAVKAVEYHHRRITFTTLARSICSKRLRTLCLSGDMLGQVSKPHIESLLTFLCSPGCAALSELVLAKYQLSTRMSELQVWQARLPRITRLWLSSFVVTSTRIAPYGHEDVSCQLPQLFNTALVHLSGAMVSFSDIRFTNLVLSNRDWPTLTSLSLVGVQYAPWPGDLPEKLDMSHLHNLTHLEMVGAGFLTAAQLIYPPSLRSLAIVFRGTSVSGWHPTRFDPHHPLHALEVSIQMQSVGDWLKSRRPREMPNLQRLRIRTDCPRNLRVLELWKVVIFSLALRERALAISSDIALLPREPLPFEEHPPKQGGAYDIFRPLFRQRR